jgi:hypothetical protein
MWYLFRVLSTCCAVCASVSALGGCYSVRPAPTSAESPKDEDSSVQEDGRVIQDDRLRIECHFVRAPALAEKLGLPSADFSERVVYVVGCAKNSAGGTAIARVRISPAEGGFAATDIPLIVSPANKFATLFVQRMRNDAWPGTQVESLTPVVEIKRLIFK